LRIASKINAALFAAVACGALATIAVLNATIQPRFDEIERQGALANHKRVLEALDAMTERLETATHDYAYWDQSHKFLQGEGVDEFIASNLEPEFKAVDNLGVNALVFVRKDGTVAWGEAFDLETENAIGRIVQELTDFGATTPGHTSAQPIEEKGLVKTSRGLALVAIAPVLKSDGTGTPVGKVITAKLLDPGRIKTMTGVDFNIDVFSDRPPESETADEVKVTTKPNQLIASSLIGDLAGRPLAYLQVLSSRDVSHAGAMAIRSATQMIVLAGLVALGVLWFYLRKIFVARIETLRTHFATAGESGTILAAPTGTGRDEISQLAQSFNTMANQVNHLRDAVADGAYMAGLSEWAAGTLHNVRNGLAPVAAVTWKIEKLFDDTWLRNVETAATECANPATAPERRQKLNAFLAGSAARFVETAKQTTSYTTQVNSATKAVLDMVMEFEHYAHRKTVFEGIDMLSVLTSVAANLAEAQAAKVDVALPDNSALVLGNSIILRQVFSNIVINACEAMESQPAPHQIAVKIEDSASDDNRVRISVADNGEGVSADRLQAIFQRGVSTRTVRSGGLGLHWCANAVKILDGTITAVSPGVGQGTTLIVELPRFQSSISKAA
jgi:two-component system, NtrC family, sensor kinase